MDIGKRLKEQAPSDVIKQANVAFTKLLQVELERNAAYYVGHW